MTPAYLGSENPSLVSFDKNDPFPYDEIVIKGIVAHNLMLIGYRIGDKWGIDNIFYDGNNDSRDQSLLSPYSLYVDA